MSTSTREAKLVRTNLAAADVIMDERGNKDCRYYCLPPFHGDLDNLTSGGGYLFHLVSQGHVVGTFTDWRMTHRNISRLEAKASLAGFPDSSNRGYHSLDELIAAWQRMCLLGIHPHPVDPAFLKTPSAQASAFVNTSPRKMGHRAGFGESVSRGGKEGSFKREGTPSRTAAESAEILADLNKYSRPVRSPPPSPRKHGHPTAERSPPAFVNFAIRGGGIVSSSADRSQQRYLDMQRRGEEPDMLVTRSFEQASRFALEDDAEGE
ncbi:hypothetical protein C8R47DRAFT_1073270 [Mycena vitilis]|nr:hypothetical protein C8R47DRAFT_1073270 [Mycena vitilis]